jgi:hypothetical protein
MARGGAAWPEASSTALAIPLTNSSGQAGWLSAAAVLVDVDQHLGFGLGDGEVAAAAEGEEHAPEEIDVTSGDDARLERLARAERTVAIDDGPLDLIEREAHVALRGPARLVEHVEDQGKFGHGFDLAIPGDARDQPTGVLGGDIALGLGLLDDVIGDRLDKAVGPGWILHRAGVVHGQDGLGLLRRDAAVVVEVAAQPQDVGILDAAARHDFRHRNGTQHTHGQVPRQNWRAR